MVYTVKYKFSGQWFWRKIKNIEGDMTEPATQQRILFLADKRRIEIPLQARFEFSSKRFFAIEANMSKEAGQKMEVKS